MLILLSSAFGSAFSVSWNFLRVASPRIVQLRDWRLILSCGVPMSVSAIFCATPATPCLLAVDMGAVDYVVKPFSPTELAARIRTALRKREVSEPSVKSMRGDLHCESQRL